MPRHQRQPTPRRPTPTPWKPGPTPPPTPYQSMNTLVAPPFAGIVPVDDLVRVQEVRTVHDRLHERDHHERRLRAPRLVDREGRVRRIRAEIVPPLLPRLQVVRHHEIPGDPLRPIGEVQGLRIDLYQPQGAPGGIDPEVLRALHEHQLRLRPAGVRAGVLRARAAGERAAATGSMYSGDSHLTSFIGRRRFHRNGSRLRRHVHEVVALERGPGRYTPGAQL